MSLFNFSKPKEKTSDTPEHPKILVVDDEQYLNDMYVELLSTEGYSVSSAFNGKDALALIKKDPPQLIILDVMMPVMNGNDVLAALQERDETKRIPVIVLTNAVAIENRANADMYNAYKFLVKANTDPAEIIKLVKEALTPKNPMSELEKDAIN